MEAMAAVLFAVAFVVVVQGLALAPASLSLPVVFIVGAVVAYVWWGSE